MNSENISALPPSHYRIASFGRRRGRKLRPQKADLFDTVLPDVALALPAASPLNVTALFPDSEQIWLEIGFGGGEHLAAQAERNPRVGCIGCEPYINGIGGLLQAIKEKNLKNIRVFSDDARALIDSLPSASIDRVFILFPDPWPKARHHKRRLISVVMLNALARIIKPAGQLRIATDHEDYPTWILEHMAAETDFSWQAKKMADWLNPPADWVITRYEEKARCEGRPSTYLDYVRV